MASRQKCLDGGNGLHRGIAKKKLGDDLPFCHAKVARCVDLLGKGHQEQLIVVTKVGERAAVHCNRPCRKSSEEPSSKLPEATVSVEIGEVNKAAESRATLSEQEKATCKSSEDNDDAGSRSDLEKKIKCRICHKLLKPLSLRQHVRSHSGQKPFVCKQCQACFTRKGDMERHVRIVHEKQRPHKCHLCPRAFADQKNLRWHIANHNLKLFYVCSVCCFKFGKREYWENHVRFIHPTAVNLQEEEGSLEAAVNNVSSNIQSDILRSVPQKVPINVPSNVLGNLPIKVPNNVPINVLSSVRNKVPISIPSSVLSHMLSKVVSDVPSNAPLEVPFSALNNLPSVLLSNIPSSVSNNILRSVQRIVPSIVLSNIPSNVPSKVPISLPGSVLRNVPSNISSNVLSNMQGKVLRNIRNNASISVPSNVLSNIPNYVLRNIQSNIPSIALSKVPKDVPSNVPNSLPVDLPSDVLSNVPISTPRKGTADVDSCVSVNEHIVELFTVNVLDVETEMSVPAVLLQLDKPGAHHDQCVDSTDVMQIAQEEGIVIEPLSDNPAQAGTVLGVPHEAPDGSGLVYAML